MTTPIGPKQPDLPKKEETPKDRLSDRRKMSKTLTLDQIKAIMHDPLCHCQKSDTPLAHRISYHKKEESK